jgi:chemotaxis protein CheY-P-specific phosphatase CheC
METITNTELTFARKIVNQGLLKAAESLSFFMKETISLDELDYSFNKSPNPADFTTKKGENIHLLLTEVIGELKGVCCLIFSNDEADKLRHTALSPEIMSNPEIMAEMSDGILLEVDNIISASVITQFSNILKHKIHGGVPKLKRLNDKEVNQYVKSKLEDDMFIISFNTHFVSANLDFSPQFLWLFDSSFTNSIKKFAADEANTASII